MDNSYLKTTNTSKFRGRRRVKTLNQAKLIYFVNSVMEYLRQKGNDEQRRQVKWLVQECVQQHRKGDKNFRPLSRSILLLIRQQLGPQQYAEAQVYYQERLRQALQSKLKTMTPYASFPMRLTSLPIMTASLPLPRKISEDGASLSDIFQLYDSSLPFSAV